MRNMPETSMKPLMAALILVFATTGTFAAAPAADASTPPPARSGEPTRLAVDAAHSWLIPPAKFEAGATLIARAGFTCARERMNWGEVEPQRGVFQWGKYDLSANAAQAHGIEVCQVFHNIPRWARADGVQNRYPDDLRDAYNFCHAAAVHFRGRVQTWEVWNEADIRDFSPETGDAGAAFLKAAYLGFKSGDPAVKVAQVSMALGAGRFEEALLRNDSAAYLDIFNYHIYDRPGSYPARAQGHFDLLDKYDVPPVPVWVTEAGIVLNATASTLSDPDRRKQAEFIPKSFVMSLASSTDRHFFFVFPHYLENGHEFGTMDADLRPYPGYQALATATAMLGRAAYLGRVALGGGRGVQAHLFDNGLDNTLVVWHEGGTTNVPVPTAIRGVALRNCLGEEIGKAADTLAVGESALYLRIPQGVLQADGKPLAARRLAGKPRTASTIVVRVIPPDDTGSKEVEAYRFKAGESVSLRVEAYNFSDQARNAHLTLEAPQGWQVSPPSLEVPIAAMGRESRTVSIVPGSAGGLRRQALRCNLKAGDGASGTAVLEVLLDPASLKPAVRVPLRLASGERWTANISGNGSMTATTTPEGEWMFDAHFDKPGDRWMYPTVAFTTPRDWRHFDAIELETRLDPVERGTVARLMVTEPSDAAYFTASGFTSGTAWTRAIIPFSSLAPGGFAPADANGRLDLDQIKSLRLGCNTAKDHAVLRVRNLALVQYGP